MRRLGNILFGALALGGAITLHYWLPFHDTVRIVGAEVVSERVDNADPSTNPRDVRFINAVDADGEPRVYRNEDTGWSWPPYFKFSSADLAAAAEQAGSQGGSWGVVTHYGWRIPFLSFFPNAVSISPASGPVDSAFPYTAMIVFALYAAVIVWLWRRLFGVVRSTDGETAHQPA